MRDLSSSARARRAALVLILLVLLTLLLLLLSVRMGSVSLSADALWEAFRGRGDPAVTGILMQIRLPRALTALLLGGALSLSGLLLQTFFHNPIAGPFVLGISSGAKLMVALAMFWAARALRALNSLTLVAAAFAGALLVTGALMLLARRLDRAAALLVAGIMVGYVCSAATDLVLTFAPDQEAVSLRSWSLGTFSGAGWEALRLAAPLTALGLAAAFALSKPMGAYLMGEAHAQSVGVNVRAFRRRLVLLSCLLSACVTAWAGPISFVGIAVPFLVKRLMNTSRPLWVIPGTFLGGAVFCLLSDLVARTAFAPVELSISTVTSLFGAPVVLMMMLERHKGRL